jgi:hypothetical protein
VLPADKDIAKVIMNRKNGKTVSQNYKLLREVTKAVERNRTRLRRELTIADKVVKMLTPSNMMPPRLCEYFKQAYEAHKAYKP